MYQLVASHGPPTTQAAAALQGLAAPHGAPPPRSVARAACAAAAGAAARGGQVVSAAARVPTLGGRPVPPAAKGVRFNVPEEVQQKTYLQRQGMRRCTVYSGQQMEFANAEAPLKYFQLVDSMKQQGSWRSTRGLRTLSEDDSEMTVENIWESS
mmetsp:Transcript_89360/g.289298  ORF Transcript_89360/g.289298 Transcript_89360/m.289298 type:complete len:154 (+) Transcript_89360:77-538(+)